MQSVFHLFFISHLQRVFASHTINMAKFELTTRICQYLDPHLTFPLLEFLCDKQVNRKIAVAIDIKQRRWHVGGVDKMCLVYSRYLSLCTAR